MIVVFTQTPWLIENQTFRLENHAVLEISIGITEYSASCLTRREVTQ